MLGSMLMVTKKDRGYCIMVMEAFHTRDGSKTGYPMELEKHIINKVWQWKQIG